jgi:ABC-2 type transport system permease protein
MKKLMLVARQEYIRYVRKRGFMFTVLSVPLVICIAAIAAFFLGDKQPAAVATIGYVDQSGILASLTAEQFTATGQELAWTPFAEPSMAKEALAAGEIQAYFVIPPEYPTSADVALVYDKTIDQKSIQAFSDLLRMGLLSSQPQGIADRMVGGTHFTFQLQDGRQFSPGLSLAFLLPALSALLMMVLILIGSGYLMQAVVDEKSNRTMEVLTTSVSPGQLILGKILGIITVTFTQLVMWMVFIVLAYLVGARYFEISWLQNLQFDFSALILPISLVVPAFISTAAIMTAIGSLLAEPHAGQQVSAVFVLLYLLPVSFIMPLLSQLNSSLAVGLSIFPLSAPVVMTLRAAFTVVPGWQLITAEALQWLLALVALWLAARALRIGMLRYGKPFLIRARKRSMAGAAGEVVSSREDGLRGQGIEPRMDYSRSRVKLLHILRHEIFHVIKKPYFILIVVGMPLLIFGQMWLMMRSFDEEANAATPVLSQSQTMLPVEGAQKPVGYVDHSGLITMLPAQVPSGSLIPFEDEAQASQALDSGQIVSYVIIPADYIHTGDLVNVVKVFNPQSQIQQQVFQWTLLVNLLNGDETLAERVWTPFNLQVSSTTAAPTAQAEAEAAERAEDNARLTMMLILLVFYGAIVMGSSLLLRSVSEEKMNRVMEIFLTSVSPFQILAGKTIALGLASLLQMVGWVVIGYGLFSLGGMNFTLSSGLQLTPEVFFWSAVMLVLGYSIYAALMAGAGALLPNWREGTSITLVLVLPALLGFEITLWAQDPNSLIMVLGSLFPFTAPMVMVGRLLMGEVPLWHLLLSSALMIFTSYLVVQSVARLFRAQYLLSGQSLSIGRYFKALTGRV